MKVRIYRIANQFGITKAYRLKIKGYVFPRKKNDWYFTDSEHEAISMGLSDWNLFKLEQDSKEACPYCKKTTCCYSSWTPDKRKFKSGYTWRSK